MKCKKVHNKAWKHIKLCFLIGIPVTLWSLPVDFFDNSISLFALFGVEDYAYSTGITKAIMHLMHFDFQGAAKYNKLSFTVLPMLFLLWLKLFFNILGIKILKWF